MEEYEDDFEQAVMSPNIEVASGETGASNGASLKSGSGGSNANGGISNNSNSSVQYAAGSGSSNGVGGDGINFSNDSGSSLSRGTYPKRAFHSRGEARPNPAPVVDEPRPQSEGRANRARISVGPVSSWGFAISGDLNDIDTGKSDDSESKGLWGPNLEIPSLTTSPKGADAGEDVNPETARPRTQHRSTRGDSRQADTSEPPSPPDMAKWGTDGDIFSHAVDPKPAPKQSRHHSSQGASRSSSGSSGGSSSRHGKTNHRRNKEVEKDLIFQMEAPPQTTASQQQQTIVQQTNQQEQVMQQQQQQQQQHHKPPPPTIPAPQHPRPQQPHPQHANNVNSSSSNSNITQPPFKRPQHHETLPLPSQQQQHNSSSSTTTPNNNNNSTNSINNNSSNKSSQKPPRTSFQRQIHHQQAKPAQTSAQQGPASSPPHQPRTSPRKENASPSSHPEANRPTKSVSQHSLAQKEHASGPKEHTTTASASPKDLSPTPKETPTSAKSTKPIFLRPHTASSSSESKNSAPVHYHSPRTIHIKLKAQQKQNDEKSVQLDALYSNSNTRVVRARPQTSPPRSDAPIPISLEVAALISSRREKTGTANTDAKSSIADAKFSKNVQSTQEWGVLGPLIYVVDSATRHAYNSRSKSPRSFSTKRYHAVSLRSTDWSKVSIPIKPQSEYAKWMQVFADHKDIAALIRDADTCLEPLFQSLLFPKMQRDELLQSIRQCEQENARHTHVVSRLKHLEACRVMLARLIKDVRTREQLIQRIRLAASNHECPKREEIFHLTQITYTVGDSLRRWNKIAPTLLNWLGIFGWDGHNYQIKMQSDTAITAMLLAQIESKR